MSAGTCERMISLQERSVYLSNSTVSCDHTLFKCCGQPFLSSITSHQVDMLTFSDWVAGAAAIVSDLFGFPKGFLVRETKLETSNK